MTKEHPAQPNGRSSRRAARRAKAREGGGRVGGQERTLAPRMRNRSRAAGLTCVADRQFGRQSGNGHRSRFVCLGTIDTPA